MTKYILHGGQTRETNDDNRSFFRETTSGFESKIKILLCYFSREEQEILECASQDKDLFIKNSSNKSINFEIADENNLSEQLKKTDIFYLRGGNTVQLVEKMRKTENLETLFEDKVVAGSSAGVYVFAKYFWENDNDKIGEGLGIFNIKAFCHYAPNDAEKIKQLIEYKENLPLFTLPNFKWVIWYK